VPRHPDTLLEGDINTVEEAAAIEDELRRIDIHHPDVAAEGHGHPLWLHDPTHGEDFITERCEQRDRGVLRQPVACGKLLGDDQAIRLGQKREGIGDLFVIPLQGLLPHAAIAGHVDAQDEDIALAGIRRPHPRFDDWDSGAHTSDSTNLVQNRFRNAALDCRHL